MNWVDFVIVGVLLFYAIEGYALGALPAFFDLLQFSASFLLGLQFYGLFSPFLVKQFSLPNGLSNAISFFLIAFVAEFLLHFFFRFLLKNTFKESFLLKPELKRLNRILGIFPGLLSGMVLMMFILTVVVSLPLSPFLRQTITNATLGKAFLARSQLFEKQISGVFGNAAHDTMNFLTVEPESSSSVSLHFTYKNGLPDEQVEQQMLQMVNNERTKVGLREVARDLHLQQVARDHAQDMLQRGYFSHYTPEGLNPFDRMDKAGISYNAAGENLAFSPNVDLAMQGLMNSPGHRANILSKDFEKVGIGVIDAGIYGQMFVQEFTN